jgi:hypothetical protein
MVTIKSIKHYATLTIKSFWLKYTVWVTFRNEWLIIIMGPLVLNAIEHLWNDALRLIFSSSIINWLVIAIWRFAILEYGSLVS